MGFTRLLVIISSIGIAICSNEVEKYASIGISCSISLDIDIASLDSDSFPKSIDRMLLESVALNPTCSLIQFYLNGSQPLKPPHKVGALFSTASNSKYLTRYSLAILTKICYAAHHNYYLYLYLGHQIELPANYTGHYLRAIAFSRIFDLGHPYLLYSDLDSVILLHSIPPIEVFMKKDLNLQSERILCSCAIAMKNSEWSVNFIHTWWDLGHTGCCKTADWDQNSFSWLIAEELQPTTPLNITLPLGSRTFYDLSEHQSHPKIHFIEPFIQINQAPNPRHHYNIPQIQLHHCAWKGCRSSMPALLYHTGSDAFFKVIDFLKNETLKWIDFTNFPHI